MIEFKNVSYDFDFKKPIFSDLNLKIKQGEKVLLLGRNGSGKTTLLRILAGLYHPKKGEYIFKGNLVDKKSIKETDFYRKIGFLFQNPDAMCFTSSVEEEIFFGLERTEEKEKLLQELVDLLDLKKLMDKNPLSLSGGEKQKVLLASVLLKEPDLLLLDEPISNLDPWSSGWLGEFLSNYFLTMIVATQSLSWGKLFANRVIILSDEHKIIWNKQLTALKKDFPSEELLLENKLAYKTSSGKFLSF